MATVRVSHNIWGNYDCFLGRERVEKYGNDFDAKVWLAKQIKAGHKVSSLSFFSELDVADYDFDKPAVARTESGAIDMRPMKVYDVWKDGHGRLTALEATKAIVDDSDAPYGYYYHEIRVEAHDRREAIAKARKA